MLQQKLYVPLLKTGAAEISAYCALFPDVRPLVFPIFHARPWPNARHFSFTINKVLDAVGGYPFGFALDTDRRGHANTRPAQSEFDALFDETRGFEAYYDVVAALPSAIPVLIPTRSADVLLHQIANADSLNRGLIIHQRRGAVIPLSSSIIALPPLPDDTLVVIDAGWSRNYLELEAWTIPTVERTLNALPSAELVVMSSSFPDSFSHIVGNATEEGSERRLFAAAVQRFQMANLTYGDWGSTRPNQGGGGGAAIPSRVDIPTFSTWEVFRANPDDDRGFAEMAWEAQHHACFIPTPDCWGKQMISVTNDQGEGISSRQISTQVRVNIHMTVQSGAESVLPTDETPYED